MKCWNPVTFAQTTTHDLGGLISDFANRHSLEPGELVIVETTKHLQSTPEASAFTHAICFTDPDQLSSYTRDGGRPYITKV